MTTATTTRPRAIDVETIVSLKKGDKVTFIGTLTNDKHVTRSIRRDNTHDGNPYIILNNHDVEIDSCYFHENAIVTAINNKPYEVPAPAPVTPPPAKGNKGNKGNKPPKAPKAPQAPASPAPVDHAPVYTDTLADIARMIDVFSQQGNIEAVQHLTAVITRLSVDSVASYNAQPETPAPVTNYNPNKPDRASKQAPAPEQGNSYTVILPMFEACETVDPALKNYVNPALFTSIHEIEALAHDLAQAAMCDIRVYMRRDWVWLQPVHTVKGYGRTAVFAAACKSTGVRYSPKRGQAYITIDDLTD